MPISYKALPTDIVHRLRSGGTDAHGRVAERHPAPAGGAPCRHCLRDIPEGQELLIAAYRPFAELQPYAEVGPIFLCANDCDRHPDTPDTPAMFLDRERLLVKGYYDNDRIKYSTCTVVQTDSITGMCEEILAEPDVAYIHLRSATANCFQCRVERG